jgi:outer membrane protein
LGIIFVNSTVAQKLAYIDLKYILEQMPEYEEAKKELDKIASEWQKIIEKKYEEIERMKSDFEREKILLSDEMKQKRLKEIAKKEEEARKFQKEKFGINGDLFKKKQELLKPIQEKIYKAVRSVAVAEGYDIVLDRSSGEISFVYAKEKYNLSEKVLKKLGITPKNQ